MLDLIMQDLHRFGNIEDTLKFRKNIILIVKLIKYLICSGGFRAVFFYRLGLRVKGVEISPMAKIGAGLLIPHPQCIVIGKGAILGTNVTIQQGVSIGANINKSKNGKKYPIVGNNALIGAGAKILGPISIGDNSIIGANAVVTKDIPNNSIAVGVPAKVIKTVKIPYPEFLLNNKKL